MTPLLALHLAAPVAEAFEPHEQLRLELVAGGEVSGYFYACEERALVLTADGERRTVQLNLVDAAWRNGEPLAVDALLAEAELCYAARLAEATRPDLWRPPPLAVGAASAVWPGAGHALLGDWGTALGYSIVELGLLGAASYWLFYQEQPGPILPIIALDLVFRTYAVVDSSRAARRRRQLVLSPMTGGEGGLWVGVIINTGPNLR